MELAMTLERSGRSCWVAQSPFAQLGPAARPLRSATQRQIDKDPACVRGRVVHAADPRPAPSHLEQSLLHQILGLLQIPNDQVRSPQQALGALGDEPFKVGALHRFLKPYRPQKG